MPLCIIIGTYILIAGTYNQDVDIYKQDIGTYNQDVDAYNHILRCLPKGFFSPTRVLFFLLLYFVHGTGVNKSTKFKPKIKKIIFRKVPSCMIVGTYILIVDTYN